MTELSDKILIALAEGKQQKKIAEELGCSPKYVSLLYVSLVRPKNGEPRQRIKDKILHKFAVNAEKTCEQIADELGCNLEYVRKISRETNQPKKTRDPRPYLKPLVVDALLQNSENYADIARRVGCNKTYVTHIARNMFELPPKCGKKITVPHNPATLAPPDIVPVE